MLKLKKILSMVLAMMVITSVGTTTFAVDNSGQAYRVNGAEIAAQQLEDLNEGTLVIEPSSKRIDSNGSFTFDFRTTLTSTKFKVNATSATISINASVENPLGDDITDAYPNHKYQIILYKDGFIDSKVDEEFFYADGNTYEFTAINLNTDSTYYFMLLNNDYLPAGTTLVGYGDVSSYVHP